MTKINTKEEEDLIMLAKTELDHAMQHSANAAAGFNKLGFINASKEIKGQIGDMYCSSLMLKSQLDRLIKERE